MVWTGQRLGLIRVLWRMKGVMSDSAGVFRRELEIEFRGSDALRWRLSPGLSLLGFLYVLGLCPMSFLDVSTILILQLLMGRPQNFRKKGEKEEDRMLGAHSRPTCFCLHLLFGVAGGCLGFHAICLYFSWAALATGLPWFYLRSVIFLASRHTVRTWGCLWKHLGKSNQITTVEFTVVSKYRQFSLKNKLTIKWKASWFIVQWRGRQLIAWESLTITLSRTSWAKFSFHE